MNISRRSWNVALAVMIAVAFTVSANTQISAHSVQKSLPTIRLGYMVEQPQLAPDLDPAFISDSFSQDVVQMVYANLVQLTPAGKAVPDLAKTWSVSKDHKTWKFNIRSNARFSDGKHVTASDVVYTVQRALSHATNSPLNFYLQDLVGYANYSAGKSSSLPGVKALNSSTVQFRLDKPIAYFLYTLSYPIADVVEKSRVDGKTPETFLVNTCSANVGAGPFKFVCQNSSSAPSSFYPSGTSPKYTLVPNKYFYGPKPKVNVVLPGVVDDQTSYSAYKAGGIDMARLPRSIAPNEKGKKDFYDVVASYVEYLSLDFATPPFNNLHCRLALAYAIDKKTIAQKVYHGTAAPLYGMLPKGMLGYINDAKIPHFDPAKARSELAQCPGGIHIDYYYRHTNSDYDAEAAAIQAMLANVGINIGLKGLTRSDWLKLVATCGEPLAKNDCIPGVHMVFNDWNEDYPDPQDYCDYLLRSHSNNNVGDFNSPQYDKLIDKANLEANKKTRAKLYQQAQHLALSQVAWIPLINGHFTFLLSPKIHGFGPDYSLGSVWPKNNDWSKVTVSK